MKVKELIDNKLAAFVKSINQDRSYALIKLNKFYYDIDSLYALHFNKSTDDYEHVKINIDKFESNRRILNDDVVILSTIYIGDNEADQFDDEIIDDFDNVLVRINLNNDFDLPIYEYKINHLLTEEDELEFINIPKMDFCELMTRFSEVKPIFVKIKNNDNLFIYKEKDALKILNFIKNGNPFDINASNNDVFKKDLIIKKNDCMIYPMDDPKCLDKFTMTYSYDLNSDIAM